MVVMRTIPWLWLAISACRNAALAPDVAPDPLRTEQAATLVFENVRLVSMTRNAVQDRQTVIIRDGRIAAIAESGTIAVPESATVIQGRGPVPASRTRRHARARQAPGSSQDLRAGVAHVRNMWDTQAS
jgi:hypothetical protein